MTRLDRYGERIEADEEGMSTRAIAPIVGASQRTVADDIQLSDSAQSKRPATVTSLDGRQRPATQPRPPAEILAHCAELRQILADARDRREATS